MTTRKKILFAFIAFLILPFLIPQNFTMPVAGAGQSDYNKDTFWYYPWGKSGTHKGVDIFAKAGTPLHSSTMGWVIYTGTIKMGGNVVLILGPKWRLHYYAHLKDIKTSNFSWSSNGEQIGTVGTSGNAQGKPPHLHYSIVTLFPYPWRIDDAPQGWKKMFYLNPIDYLKAL